MDRGPCIVVFFGNILPKEANKNSECMLYTYMYVLDGDNHTELVLRGHLDQYRVDAFREMILVKFGLAW